VNDRWAKDIFAAYQRGLLNQSQRNGWENQFRSFDFLFKQVFWLRVSLPERLPISKIWRLSSEGLRLCRKNLLIEALGLFSRCWTDLSKATLSPQGSFLALAPLEAAHAYLEYKKGDFALARTRILHAMEADLQLELEEEWFGLLEMHRLQAAQNLMRIDIRAGSPRQAIALGGKIISYVHGFTEALPVHHSWQGRKLLEKIPRTVRRALIPQVANEVALAFCYFPQSNLEVDFLASTGTQDYADCARVLHEQFRSWLLAKHALQQEDWDRYFELLLEFLSAGPTDVRMLWYSTVLDILTLCYTCNNPASHKLSQKILHDRPKWSTLPEPLRLLLDSDQMGCQPPARARESEHREML